MRQCPVCGSEEIYQYKKYFQYSATGEALLPKLGSNFFSVAKVRPAVCVGCGHVWLFASEDARNKVKNSKHWKPVKG